MFGISGQALKWFSSCLSDSVQAVSVNGWVSSQKKLHWGVPQGSVLGPVFLTLYIQPLSEVIFQSRCGHHKFAPDFHSMIVDVEQCVDCLAMDDW